MVDQSDAMRSANNHDAEMRRAAQLTQDQERMAVARRMEQDALTAQRLAAEKMAEQKKQQEEQKNVKKGPELDEMFMAGLGGLTMFGLMRGTVEGVRNMLDPKTTSDITAQSPHLEINAGVPGASPAGGIVSLLMGNALGGSGSNSSSPNAQKPQQPAVGMGMNYSMG